MSTNSLIAAFPPSRPGLTLSYSEDDSRRASSTWRANCGPHSLAAATGLTLDQVRAVLPRFRGLMNPTEISEALKAIGVPFSMESRLRTYTLINGINRIQSEGWWLDAGVDPREAYKHTHYVAHFDGWVMCTACDPAVWAEISFWADFFRKEYGPFHITHHFSFALDHGKLRPRTRFS